MVAIDLDAHIGQQMLGRATAFKEVAHHRDDRLAAVKVADTDLMRHSIDSEHLLQTLPVMLVEHDCIEGQQRLDACLIV
ncbi:hypothetical protein OKW11_000248 [Pseudomonas baetica]|nr:hypothetical protein [Pseudomonas baetica]MDF9773291.1 hypothetical protein [Pseudomonas baetica]